MINRLALRNMVLEELDGEGWELIEGRFDATDAYLVREGIIKEFSKDTLQFVVAALVEYGSMLASAGTGAAGPSEVAETVVDLAFLGESVASAISTLNSVVSVGNKLGQIYDKFKEQFDGKPISLDDLYSSVKEIVTEVMRAIGPKAEEVVDKIRTSIQDLLDKLANTVGDGIKAIIPDAIIGGSVGETVFGLLALGIRGAGTNCYTPVASALNAAGKYSQWLLNPAIALKAFDDYYPKLIETCEELAQKLGDKGFLEKAQSMGIDILKYGPVIGAAKTGLVEGARAALPIFVEYLKLTQASNRNALEGLVKIVIPATLFLLAALQVLMRGEYKQGVKSAEVPEAPEAAEEEPTVKGESRLSLLDIDSRILFLESTGGRVGTSLRQLVERQVDEEFSTVIPPSRSRRGGRGRR